MQVSCRRVLHALGSNAGLASAERAHQPVPGTMDDPLTGPMDHQVCACLPSRTGSTGRQNAQLCVCGGGSTGILAVRELHDASGRYRRTVGTTLLSFPEILEAIVVRNWAVTPRIRRPRHNCFRDAEYRRQRRYPREQDPTRGQLLARKTAHLE